MVKYCLLFLATFAFGNDLLTLYRQHDLQAVQQHLDQQLTDIRYWEAELQPRDTRFGYFENTNALLSCDKNQSKLQFFRKDENGTFVHHKSFGAYTGKANGDKFKEGDLKTPVGVYRLTQKLNNLDPFYGPMAFVTSYPNFYDKIRGKNGSGIWIHGLPADAAREPYTRGCIAIENTDLECLDRTFNYQHALLIIDEHPNIDADKHDLALILSEVYRWRYAWIYNDFKSYLNFYATDFRRFDGMDYETFKRYKTRIFAKNETKQIRFYNMAVVPYPGESESLFIVYFDEDYQSSSYHFTGQKGLIVRVAQGHMQILAEQ